MVEAKPEVVTGLTVKAFIVGLIGCIFTALVSYERYYGFLKSDILDYWHQNFTGLSIVGGAFAWILVLALVNQGAQRGWWKFRFSPQEVGVVVIFAMLGAYLSEGSYQQPFEEWFTEGMYVAQQSKAKQAEFWAKFPDTLAFGPKSPEPYASLLKVGFGRTLAVDWGPFMPMIFAGVLWYGSAMLFYVFGSLLLRRLYTRVEYLPMPFTEVMSSFISLTQPASKKVKLFTEKTFLMGFLLSFIYHFVVKGLPPWQTLATGAPPTAPWYGPINLYPAWDLTEKAWLPWSGIYITLAPWEIGWALILPTNVLISSLITWFAMYIIFPLVYMRTYWGPFTAATMGDTNSAIRVVAFNWNFDDLGFSLSAITMGMLFAAVFAPIVLNWHQMAPVFKGLVKEPPSEFDPDKPLSYRLTWILTIGFFLLWYIVGVTLVQAKPDALLGFLVLIAILFFGAGRVLSETGGWYGAFHLNPYYTYEGATGALASTYFTKLGKDIPSYVTVYMMSQRGHMYSFGDRVPFYTLHSFKLGDNTRTRLNGVLKILIIGTVIGISAAAIIHFFNRAYSITIFGGIRGEYVKNAISYAERGRTHRSYGLWANTPTQAFMQIGIGFAVIFALSFLQPRISLLRGLSIGGIIWGVNALYILWSAWIVGFIIKYIVLRTGGTRMYESTLKPFGLGLVAGAFLTLFLADAGQWLSWLIHSRTAGVLP